MESIQATTPSFMPPVGTRTLPLWTQLLQTDDSQLIDILRTGFEDGFSSFEEAWEQLQQLSPSLLNTSLAAKQDSFLMGVPFDRRRIPASSSGSIASSSQESSQPSDALARERAELSQLMFTATQTSAELILNKVAAIGSPEAEAEILSKFNPGNPSVFFFLPTANQSTNQHPTNQTLGEYISG
ncbi:hypothetical protein QOT17_019456 [Balamuthia mandrillaris]